MKIISSLDFLSPQNSIYYKKKLSHSNIFSGVISLITIGGIIAISIYFLLEFLGKENPITYNYYQNEMDVRKISLGNDGVFHYIVVGEDGKINFKAYTIYASDQVIYSLTNYKNFLTNDFWLFGECDEEDYNKVKENIPNKENFLRGGCYSKYWNHIDQKLYDKRDKENFKYPYIQYGKDDSVQTYFSLIVEKCSNNSINQLKPIDDCLSETEIDNIINDDKYVTLYLLDQNIYVGDYKEPVKTYLLNIQNTIVSIDSYTVNHLNYYPGKIISNDGIIFDNKKITDAFIYNTNEKATSQINEYPILCCFAIWFQNTVQIYYRKYSSLLDAFASIGGLGDLILKVTTVINYFFYEYVLFNDSLNDIIDNIKNKSENTKIKRLNKINNKKVDKNEIKRSKKNIKDPHCRYSTKNSQKILNSKNGFSTNKQSDNTIRNTDNNNNNYVISEKDFLPEGKVKAKEQEKNNFQSILEQNFLIKFRNIGFLNFIKMKNCTSKNKNFKRIINLRMIALSEEFLFKLFYIHNTKNEHKKKEFNLLKK